MDYGREIRIMLMGATGSGKSTFINLVSGSDMIVGRGLESCTSDVQVSIPFLLNRYIVTLIDTPGFDDTTRSDSDILARIAAYLAKIYEQGVKLTGVIYMHRISDVRMTGVARRNFRIFRQLCGENALQNALIVTNMWGTVEPEIAEAREYQLSSNDTFFRAVLEQGARLLRHDGTQASAQAILHHFVGLEETTLLIQDEIVNKHKNLIHTAAGAELDSDLREQTKRHEKELKQLHEEMDAALRNKDEEVRLELQEQLNKGREELDRIKRDSERMAVGFAEERSQLESKITLMETENRHRIQGLQYKATPRLRKEVGAPRIEYVPTETELPRNQIVQKSMSRLLEGEHEQLEPSDQERIDSLRRMIRQVEVEKKQAEANHAEKVGVEREVADVRYQERIHFLQQEVQHAETERKREQAEHTERVRLERDLADLQHQAYLRTLQQEVQCTEAKLAEAARLGHEQDLSPKAKEGESALLQDKIIQLERKIQEERATAAVIQAEAEAQSLLLNQCNKTLEREKTISLQARKEIETLHARHNAEMERAETERELLVAKLTMEGREREDEPSEGRKEPERIVSEQDRRERKSTSGQQAQARAYARQLEQQNKALKRVKERYRKARKTIKTLRIDCTRHERELLESQGKVEEQTQLLAREREARAPAEPCPLDRPATLQKDMHAQQDVDASQTEHARHEIELLKCHAEAKERAESLLEEERMARRFAEKQYQTLQEEMQRMEVERERATREHAEEATAKETEEKARMAADEQEKTVLRNRITELQENVSRAEAMYAELQSSGNIEESKRSPVQNEAKGTKGVQVAATQKREAAVAAQARTGHSHQTKSQEEARACSDLLDGHIVNPERLPGEQERGEQEAAVGQTPGEQQTQAEGNVQESSIDERGQVLTLFETEHHKGTEEAAKLATVPNSAPSQNAQAPKTKIQHERNKPDVVTASPAQAMNCHNERQPRRPRDSVVQPCEDENHKQAEASQNEYIQRDPKVVVLPVKSQASDGSRPTIGLLSTGGGNEAQERLAEALKRAQPRQPEAKELERASSLDDTGSGMVYYARQELRGGETSSSITVATQVQGKTQSRLGLGRWLQKRAGLKKKDDPSPLPVPPALPRLARPSGPRITLSGSSTFSSREIVNHQ